MYISSQVKSVQALLFVNDFAEQFMPFYRPHIHRSESKGVRVYIHPANTLPEMGKGFNIPPGHEVKIGLKATKVGIVKICHIQDECLPNHILMNRSFHLLSVPSKSIHTFIVL